MMRLPRGTGPMKRFCSTIPQDQWDELSSLMRQTGLTRSALVRMAITTLVERPHLFLDLTPTRKAGAR